jgi:hypothetical protein
MSYDTALSLEVFYVQFGVGLVANFIFLALIVATSVAAAEGLGRLADAQGALNHFQFFDIFTRGGPAAVPDAGVGTQVAVAYLLVPVMFAYEVLFYFVMVKQQGHDVRFFEHTIF